MRIAAFDLDEETPVKKCWKGGQREASLNMDKLFRDNVYGRMEAEIIHTLYHFQYLTKHSMERDMKRKLKAKSWPSYDRLLHALYEDGAVYKYVYGNVVLYALSEKTREWWRKKTKENVIILPDHEPGDILECASLAQWHIALISPGAEKSCFMEMQKASKSKILIPSYVEMQKGEYLYTVMSFPIPKTEKGIEVFLERIYSRTAEVKRHRRKKQIFLTVLVGCRLAEFEKISCYLQHFWEPSSTFYFALDQNTVYSSGLENIYCCEENDSKTELKLISIK